jgi:hypothetical protein
VIRQGRRNDYVRGIEHSARQVLGQDRVVPEPKVEAMLLRACAKRNDDHRLRAQHIGRLLPRDVREPDALVLPLRLDPAGRRENGCADERRDEQRGMHALSLCC